VLADVSQDGKTLVFLETGGAQESQKASGAIYLRKTDGSPAIRLAEGSVSRLSPDGKYVLAAPGPEFADELQLVPTGAGELVKVPLSGLRLSWDPLWFPDGQHILARAREGQARSRLWVLDLQGGKPRPVTPEGVGVAYVLSHDGTEVAAQDSQGKLWRWPVAGGEGKEVIGARPADVPVGWSPDGQALFVYAARDAAAGIRKLDLASGKQDPWRPLTLPDPSGTGPIFSALVAADGQSFAYNYEINLQDLYLVEGVR
jgi:eukaryotic-like serine/threonine-protein kinase